MIPIAIVSVVFAVYLVRHYSAVKPDNGVFANAFWPTDGAGPLILSARQQLEPVDVAPDGAKADSAKADGAGAAPEAANSAVAVDAAAALATGTAAIDEGSGAAGGMPGQAPDSAADPKKAVEDARAALSLSPLNVAALATLAAAELQAGDKDLAERLYAIAFDRSKRMPDILQWEFQQAIAKNDVAMIVTVIDLSLRLRLNPARTNDLVTVLTQLLNDPRSMTSLKDALLRRPPWADQFLMAAAQNSSVANVTDLLDGLPAELATEKVWGALMRHMIRQGDGSRAYALWWSLRNPDSNEALPYLNDGGFDALNRGLPFDWNVQQMQGVEVSQDRSATSDGSNALKLIFVYPVPYQNVWQFLSLSAGSYRLTGKVKLDDLKAARGLQWRIYCAAGVLGPSIGESPLFQGDEGWTPFDVSFTVPAEKCDTQFLRLEIPARIPAENAISGTAWFDDFAITRQADQPAAQE